MRKVYNFSAGPSMLFDDVLKKAQSEMLDYKETGMSVMEMSHRSAPYMEISKKTQDLFKEVLNIPEGYSVLLLQGGASMQFEAVCLNLMNSSKKADYIVTGNFAKKAFSEAKKFGEAVCVASSADKNFTYIPDVDKIEYSADADYLHITHNNTIFGTKYSKLPKVATKLVCDMSSSILSEEMDFSCYDLVYAGAQKNIGPAGLTVVIVKDEILGKELDICPTMLKYSIHKENDSLYNTPPAYSIYMAMLTLEHIKEMGGIKAIQKINEYKAGLLYDYIDGCDFYQNPVEKEFRSLMNVPFTTPSAELDAKFVKEAKAFGLESIKGHRLVGGMRASIYNAMPVEGVEALITFMKKFASENA